MFTHTPLYPEAELRGILLIKAPCSMEFNPKSTSIIKRGDILIAMGEKRHLGTLTDSVGKK
jgi:uncharacterized protein with PhoU and TrkA domain